MRLRNIRGSRETIAASEYVVQESKDKKGKWHEIFQNDNPIYIEIGMGKGQFIMEHAEQNPDMNYIGIEKYSSVLLRAIQKMEETPRNNLYFIRMDAEELEEIFDQDEISGIYLNFSDPWPKDRHAKRRLTSRQFLKRYDHVLNKEGVVEFKTDNEELFRFSLEEVKETEWKLKAFTFDLHHDEELSRGNIMTEYEERFSSKGNPIHKLIAYR